MPPPDSSAIDDAIIAQLQADAALAALVPDGVWLDEAPPQCTRFVIVSLIDAIDIPTFGGRAFEHLVYLVKAVIQAHEGSTAIEAAARINVLLEDVPLTVPGYGWMTGYRLKREQANEVDDLDTMIRWQHRGGQYRIQMAVAN
jgi:hypothetical protein